MHPSLCCIRNHKSPPDPCGKLIPHHKMVTDQCWSFWAQYTKQECKRGFCTTARSTLPKTPSWLTPKSVGKCTFSCSQVLQRRISRGPTQQTQSTSCVQVPFQPLLVEPTRSSAQNTWTTEVLAPNSITGGLQDKDGWEMLQIGASWCLGNTSKAWCLAHPTHPFDTLLSSYKACKSLKQGISSSSSPPMLLV